jgi:hypothetical protein
VQFITFGNCLKTNGEELKVLRMGRTRSVDEFEIYNWNK